MLNVPAYFMSAEITDAAVGCLADTSLCVQTPSNIPSSHAVKCDAQIPGP